MRGFARSGLGLALSCMLSWTAAAAAAAAADLVVVEARGVSLRPGQAIDGGQPLLLKEGQQVVLISSAGRTLKLRGPYEQVPLGADEAGPADVGAALRTMVTAQAGRTDRMGVVRGRVEQRVPPEPWLLDVTRAGIRCLPEGTPIRLWKEGGGAATLTIAPSDRSWRARADWPAGADRLVMPPSIPLRQRTGYIVAVDGRENAITLAVLPETLGNDAMRVAWMVEAGCDGQAQALLNAAINAGTAR